MTKATIKTKGILGNGFTLHPTYDHKSWKQCVTILMRFMLLSVVVQVWPTPIVYGKKAILDRPEARKQYLLD